MAFPKTGLAREPVTFLQEGDPFKPVFADLKEPRFAAGLMKVHMPPGSQPAEQLTAVAISLGENIGLIRWQGHGHCTQLSVAAAVFAQFDIDTPTPELMNADYVIGFPLSWRKDRWSARFRAYHQSSHLGDQFLLDGAHGVSRTSLSFESLEMLGSWENASVRMLGGGEYFIHRIPLELEPGLLHAGLELRPFSDVRIRHLGLARFVAAADMKSWQEDRWSAAWNIKAGFEMGRPPELKEWRRTWSFFLQYYTGFAPYGQFFESRIHWWGLGLQFAL